MQCKLFVALQLEVAHHFIERCAGERTGLFELPPTVGATKTPKALLLNPYQLPAHGLFRCAPTLCYCRPSTPLAVEGRNVFLSQRFTAPLQQDNNHPVWAWLKMHRGTAELTCANLGGLSGILHIWKDLLFVRHARKANVG